MSSNIELDRNVVEFIEENIQLIENREWEAVYSKDVPTGFTEAMLAAGINPLYQGLNYIPDYFLFRNSDIESLEIPSNIKSVGKCAFYWCENLTSVIIPNTVTHIRESSFLSCKNLTDVTIGNNVTSIGQAAFYSCINLTRVDYLGDINSWAQIDFRSKDANPLYYAKKLYINGNEVTGANITSATKISYCAFYNCENLTHVTISNNVTSIEDFAFYFCINLTDVTIGNNVRYLGEAAFSGCENLTQIKYLGTKKEAINNLKIKNKRWRGKSNIQKIICTDGELDLI